MKSCTRFIHVPARTISPFDFSSFTFSPTNSVSGLFLCVNTATEINKPIGIAATPIANKMCLKLTRPINISNKEVAPVNNAVERFAGAINTQTTATGMIIGKKPSLKFLITSCFLLKTLEIYINKASLA